MTPVRLEDTRNNGPGPNIPANGTVCATPEGANPGDTVAANIITVEATGSGWTAARSSDDPRVPGRPESQLYSTGNFGPGTIDPNLTFAEVGSDGQFCVDSAISASNLVIDQFGVLPAGAGYESVTPVRLEDTRNDNPFNGELYPIPANEIIAGVNDPCTFFFGTLPVFVRDSNQDGFFAISPPANEYLCN